MYVRKVSWLAVSSSQCLIVFTSRITSIEGDWSVFTFSLLFTFELLSEVDPLLFLTAGELSIYVSLVAILFVILIIMRVPDGH